MKRFTHFTTIFVFLLPLLAFISCSGDDELPNVDISTTFSDNVIKTDGTLYVVKGEPLDITAVTCTNLEVGKPAIVANVTYYFDDLQLYYTALSPFTFGINTANIPTGTHLLRLVCTVAAQDKAVALALIDYPVVVVESANDIPQAGEPVGTSITNPTIVTSAQK